MQHMNKEKSDDWLDEQFDEAYEREFEEAFDLAFENAAAASTSVNKEAMAASWDKVNHEVQNIKRRKERIKRWQLVGVIAASITIGATIFSIPIGTYAGTIIQKLQQIGDDFILVFEGPEQDYSGALTPPPPDILSNPDYKENEESSKLDKFLISSDHTLFFVEVPEEKALNNTTFVVNKFEVPFTPTNIKHYLLLDEENPVYPENSYKSDEIKIEFYESNERKVTVNFNKMFSENPGFTEQSPAFSGVPEEIQLKDGSYAVYYENGNFDQLIFRKNLILVTISGSISKDNLIFIADSIQQTNHFQMKQ